GWRLWVASTILTAATFTLLVLQAWLAVAEGHVAVASGFLVLILGLLPVLLTLLLISSEKVTKWAKKRVFLQAVEGIGLRKSLAHNFRLRLKLFRLLSEDGHVPKLRECVGCGDSKLILVAAPLQILPSLNRNEQPGDNTMEQTPVQLWPTGEIYLLRALQASLAFPGLFEPFAVVDDEAKTSWLIPSVAKKVPRLDLVDGSKVRQNPLPALFSFLRREENKNVAE